MIGGAIACVILWLGHDTAPLYPLFNAYLQNHPIKGGSKQLRVVKAKLSANVLKHQFFAIWMNHCSLKIYPCHLSHWDIFAWSCMFTRCSNLDIITCSCIFRGSDSTRSLNPLRATTPGCFKTKHIPSPRTSTPLNSNVMHRTSAPRPLFITPYRNREVSTVVSPLARCSSSSFPVSESPKPHITDLMEPSSKKAKLSSVIKCGQPETSSKVSLIQVVVGQALVGSDGEIFGQVLAQGALLHNSSHLHYHTATPVF